MPNAATFNDDLAYDNDRRQETPRSAPRKPRGAAASGRKKKKSRRPRIDMHRVARYAAIGMASTMAIGIMVNALMLQKGHHPAPLFAQIPITATKPAVATAMASPSAPMLETHGLAGTGDPPPVVPSKSKKAGTARVAVSETPDASDDAIARLIAGGGAGGPARADGADPRTVTNVQRALAKLGFKVPATGTAGPATRKAIEAYEKERHLPVKGEVDRRLVKALAAETKSKVE